VIWIWQILPVGHSSDLSSMQIHRHTHGISIYRHTHTNMAPVIGGRRGIDIDAP
jgi:hypothetical protein